MRRAPTRAVVHAHRALCLLFVHDAPDSLHSFHGSSGERSRSFSSRTQCRDRSVGRTPHPQPERASRPVVDASHEVSRRALPSHKFWAGRARALARRTAPTEHRPHFPHPSAPSASSHSSCPLCALLQPCNTIVAEPICDDTVRRRNCLTNL